MFILENLLTINPDAEKLFLLSNNNFDNENSYYGEEIIDLKNNYIYTGLVNNDNITLLKGKISDLYNSIDPDVTISPDVLSQSYSILDSLYPSMIEALDIDNIYPTPYGTVILDWEEDGDKVFSLEIGAKEIGYFVEINGSDEKQVDSLIFGDNEQVLIQDLSHFLA